MMAIPHIGFILAAYAVTTVVMVATAAAILLDGRSLRRSLAKFDTSSGRGRGDGR